MSLALPANFVFVAEWNCFLWNIVPHSFVLWQKWNWHWATIFINSHSNKKCSVFVQHFHDHMIWLVRCCIEVNSHVSVNIFIMTNGLTVMESKWQFLISFWSQNRCCLEIFYYSETKPKLALSNNLSCAGWSIHSPVSSHVDLSTLNCAIQIICSKEKLVVWP